MSIPPQTRELLLALARNIVDADSQDCLMKRDNLQVLHSSLESAIRSVVVAQNGLSPINKLPPETIIAIFESLADPRIRESMFEIVKMTHICQYWRTTLISCPRLWSSIFVKNDHRDFVTACLERSRGLPLTVSLDLKYGDYHEYRNCTCIRNEWSPGMQIDEDNPCRYHTTIDPLVGVDQANRIRKLDVHLNMLDIAEEGPDYEFRNALRGFGLFAFPLSSLESFSFDVDHEFDIDSHLKFPADLFGWRFVRPAKLRHLILHGCYGGPILAVRNLTSFELAGVDEAFDPIHLDQRSFLPFISGSPSLESLTLTHCSFPDRDRLLKVTPVSLPKLKTLRLTDIYELSGFPGLIYVPAFKTLSSLHISTQTEGSPTSGSYHSTHFQVHAKNDDGFQLSYDTANDDELVSDWLDVTRSADPCLPFVRFDGQGHEFDSKYRRRLASPLPLVVNAKVLEIGGYFAGLWDHTLWKDLEKVGPQLTTLRLEVTEGMASTVVTSVKEFVEVRLEKGMPLARLERMECEGVDVEDEEKAKKIWEEFRAGLDIDRYLSLQ